MKVCLLTQSLDSQTGIGVFVGNIIKGLKKENPGIELSILTGVNNFFHTISEIKKADVVHAIDGYPYGVLAMFAGLGLDKPLIITAVGSGSLKGLTGRGFRPFLLRLAYKRASSVTAISRFVAGKIRSHCRDVSVQIIHPEIDYAFYSQSEINPALKQKYIVTQGEFKPRKGYKQMFKVMKEVMDTDPEVHFIIIGNTSRNKSHQEELNRLMDKLEIREKIEIRSAISNEVLRETYARASLYLALPTDIEGDVEGYGMAIMEAASTGTPAVVGRGSGADDTVHEGESGFLVDGSNIKEVADKIVLILKDEALREKLSIGARAWARENTGGQAKQYLELYSART